MTPYYEKGDLSLYHGKAEALLPQLPPGSFDLIFTSPPFNAMNTVGHGFFSRAPGHKWTRPALAEGYDEHDDKMPHEAYVQWQREILRGCWRLLSEDGAIFYNHKPRPQALRLVLPLELIPEEIPLRQIITWRRAGGLNFNIRHYTPMYEWILVMAKPRWKLRDQAASGAGDIWDIPHNREPHNPHPAPFPAKLPLQAIRTTGARRCLDPFCGSGSTLVACQNAGIQGVGLDKSKRYLRMAARRLDLLPARIPASQLALWGEPAPAESPQAS